MPKILGLPFYCCLFPFVTANNNTVLRGWQSDSNERGTWAILWSCLATIFICTWSCVHLDVPKREQGEWSRRAFRVAWMVLAVVVPEYFAAEGFLKLTKARTIRNGIRKRLRASSSKPAQGGPPLQGLKIEAPVSAETNRSQTREEWTITHTHFALSRGFLDQDETILRWTDPTQAARQALAVPVEPPLSAADLYSRGSADWIKKALAVLQILWFCIELLIRYIQHLHITAVEILTFAFIFCSLIIYGLCWNQPQNVEYPVMLWITEPPEEYQVTKLGVVETSMAAGASKREDENGTHSDKAIRPQHDGSTAYGTGNSGMADEQVLPSQDLQRIRSRQGSLEVAKANGEPRQHDERVVGNSNVAGRGSIQGIPLVGQCDIHDSVGSPAPPTKFLVEDLKFREKFRYAEKLTMIIGVLIGSSFGAVHCLLWNSTFPTPLEQLLWRIAAVGTACMPLSGLVGGNRWYDFLEQRLQHGAPLTYGLSVLMIWEICLLCCYVVARGTLIVLALMSLRALPADSFQEANWNNIIPHVGA